MRVSYHIKVHTISYPADSYLFKINNGNNRTISEISVINGNIYVIDIIQFSLLLALNRFNI